MGGEYAAVGIVYFTLEQNLWNVIKDSLKKMVVIHLIYVNPKTKKIYIIYTRRSNKLGGGFHVWSVFYWVRRHWKNTFYVILNIVV